MKLERISIGKGQDTKFKAILSNLGQHVILEDEHRGLCHGVLLKERYEANADGIYWIKIDDSRRETMLHYHDLLELLVIKNDPHYPRPPIK